MPLKTLKNTVQRKNDNIKNMEQDKPKNTEVVNVQYYFMYYFKP